MLSSKCKDGLTILFRPRTADEHVVKDVLEENNLLSMIPEYAPKDGDKVVDIGAHIGAFSLQMAGKVFPRGRVVAIEPHPESFELLCRNISLNGKIGEVVEPYCWGLGAPSGVGTLWEYPETWSHSTTKRPPDGTVSRQIVTHDLEEILMRTVMTCHLVKMNCEGAEYDAIMEADDWVLRRSEFWLVLYHADLWQWGNRAEDLVSRFQQADFTCREVEQTTHRGFVVARRK